MSKGVGLALVCLCKFCFVFYLDLRCYFLRIHVHLTEASNSILSGGRHLQSRQSLGASTIAFSENRLRKKIHPMAKKIVYIPHTWGITKTWNSNGLVDEKFQETMPQTPIFDDFGVPSLCKSTLRSLRSRPMESIRQLPAKSLLQLLGSVVQLNSLRHSLRSLRI